jgi:hypothetical protein
MPLLFGGVLCVRAEKSVQIGFVEQVLDTHVYVAVIVGSYDFLGELGEQRSRNIMEGKVY